MDLHKILQVTFNYFNTVSAILWTRYVVVMEKIKGFLKKIHQEVAQNISGRRAGFERAMGMWSYPLT